jgi:TATA-binding protein-associated factor Taf7
LFYISDQHLDEMDDIGANVMDDGALGKEDSEDEEIELDEQTDDEEEEPMDSEDEDENEMDEEVKESQPATRYIYTLCKTVPSNSYTVYTYG